MGKSQKKRNPLGSQVIDRASYEPAYVQLVNIIRRQISEGVYRAGDRLPSESEIRQQFGVSPMTVRRAVNMLSDQGVVSTEQGRGTFVKHLSLGTATFHLEEMQNLLGNPAVSDVQLLGAHVVEADEGVAERLNMKVGEKVIYIRRLLKVNEEPAFYHRAYIVYDPRRPILEAEMDLTSLEGLFLGEGSNIFKMGDLKIEAALMDGEEARILKSEMPSAALSITHVFYDYDNKPISWGWFICRSDQMNFKARVGVT